MYMICVYIYMQPLVLCLEPAGAGGLGARLATLIREKEQG